MLESTFVQYSLLSLTAILAEDCRAVTMSLNGSGKRFKMIIAALYSKTIKPSNLIYTLLDRFFQNASLQQSQENKMTSIPLGLTLCVCIIHTINMDGHAVLVLL